MVRVTVVLCVTAGNGPTAALTAVTVTVYVCGACVKKPPEPHPDRDIVPSRRRKNANSLAPSPDLRRASLNRRRENSGTRNRLNEIGRVKGLVMLLRRGDCLLV